MTNGWHRHSEIRDDFGATDQVIHETGISPLRKPNLFAFTEVSGTKLVNAPKRVIQP